MMWEAREDEFQERWDAREKEWKERWDARVLQAQRDARECGKALLGTPAGEGVGCAG